MPPGNPPPKRTDVEIAFTTASNSQHVVEAITTLLKALTIVDNVVVRVNNGDALAGIAGPAMLRGGDQSGVHIGDR